MPQPKVTAYSSGDYYRRPNRRRGGGGRKRNPSLLDMNTYTKILPPGIAGILLARWAVNMAGPFEDGKPGFKHALAISLMSEVGGKIVGDALGGPREVDIAQIAALSWGGEQFVQKHMLTNSEWAQKNLYLGDAGAGASSGYALGDVVQDATGTKYVLTRGGWEIIGAPMGQNDAGDIVQDQTTGACYVVQDNGELRPCTDREVADLQGFYNGPPAGASVARRLEAPTRDLPGGSSHVNGFMDHTPLGSFTDRSAIGGMRRGNASAHNSFGYQP